MGKLGGCENSYRECNGIIGDATHQSNRLHGGKFTSICLI